MTDSGDRGRPTLPEAINAAQLFASSRGAMPVLVVLTGPQLGQRIRLEEPATLGKDPECDLMLSGEGVAWHHARVEPVDGWVWRVVSLGPEAAIEVNGKPLTSHPLAPDDQISIGGNVVRFEVHSPAEQHYDAAVLERLNTDELTGLSARRKFDVELRSLFAASLRGGLSFSVVVLDIDKLKPINDVHGHLAGADVIARVGVLLREVVGPEVLACRLGGDEFAIGLVSVEPAAVIELADAVRIRVAEERFEHEGVELRVRLSGGVAHFPTNGGTPTELLRAADKALYVAKAAGGDRVQAAGARGVETS